MPAGIFALFFNLLILFLLKCVILVIWDTGDDQAVWKGRCSFMNKRMMQILGYVMLLCLAGCGSPGADAPDREKASFEEPEEIPEAF